MIMLLKHLTQVVQLTVLLALFTPTCSIMPAYATVSTTAPRNDYVGNGSVATYSYTFKIFTATDLRVTTRDTDGIETTLTYPADYTVTGAGRSSGGTITLTAGNLTSGYALTIRFDRTPRQSTDLRNQGSFYPETHEDKFDELTRYAQQNKDVIDRSIHLPETEVGTAAATTLPVAAERASQYLAFDASGNPIAAASVGTATVSAFMQTVLDDTTAAAARTTLDVPSNAEAILDTLIDAKGDLIAGSAVDTPARLAAGVNGLFLSTDSAQSTGLKWAAPSLPSQFRLTLATATAVTTTDQTAKTTLYWTPYRGNLVALYDGTRWVLRSTAELSIAVPATTSTMYDVYVYDNSGTPTLELTAWTNDTTRATALTLQDGVYVKTGATTRRYVGSFRTTGVSGQTEDSLAKRYVWNYYNRIERPMRAATETTDSWNYTTLTWRQANANAANQLDFVIGVSEDVVRATARGHSSNSSANIARAIGIGLDVTNADSSQARTAISSAMAGLGGLTPEMAEYVSPIAVGRHFLAWLEISTASGTTTWYGDNGGQFLQSGISGSLFN